MLDVDEQPHHDAHHDENRAQPLAPASGAHARNTASASRAVHSFAGAFPPRDSLTVVAQAQSLPPSAILTLDRNTAQAPALFPASMDRGRSHSRSPSGDIRRASPSPHASFQPSGLGVQSISPDASNNFNPVTTAGQQSAQYLTAQQSQPFSSQTALDQNFLQNSNAGLSQPSPQFGPQQTQGSHFSSGPLDINDSGNVDFNLFGDSSLNSGQAIDPSFLSNTLDPQLLDSQPQNQSVNPSDLMHQMATTQAQSPTPPHLLPGMNQHQHQHQQTPSPHASPNMAQGAFPSPSHSRHASLDPNAAYQVQNNEWANMSQFRGHRRTPSETYSDVSSAHASPYMGNNDSFDNDNPSPLLNAQDPSLFQEVMQFGQFNLNDNQAHMSPGHSPHISPRLIPQQQALPHFQPGSFGLDPSLNNYGQQGMGAYQTQGQEPFPTINQGPGPEFGQADTMSPPEISIEFAPPSRQASFEPPKPEHQADALSPPDRCRFFPRVAQTAPDSAQLVAGTEYAPSRIRSAVRAHARLRPVSTSTHPTDHFLRALQRVHLVRLLPLPSLLAVRPPRACPIVTTS